MKARVLVCDDDAVNLEVVRELLQDDYELTTVMNGEACLGKITEFRPDIVLLDIMMPGIDGYETCRRIKTASQDHMPQVIFISAKASTAERLRGYEVGADDYIVKPLDHDELLAKVRVQSRLKNALRELADATVKAEAAALAKSEFLANMSHEIRTQGAPSFACSAKGGGRTLARSRFLGVNQVVQVVDLPLPPGSK